jgi:dihydrofolate reductase
MGNIVYIATSLDGYIACKDGSIDWLMELPNPDNSDYGFSDFMKRIDGLIMGRNTFELVLKFGQWPYSKPVFVLSRTMNELPVDIRNKAELIHGELNTVVDELKDRGFENLYIDGGKTVQSFLKLDMIDELIITRIPIILGSGIPLFEEMDLELRFEHVQTEVLNNTLVKSRYLRKKIQ